MADPLNVLLLEDREADAELALAELRRGGFDPAWRRVETEAAYLAALEPGLDVILADYRLPQFDAPRALQHLQATGLDIPFIVFSGTIGDEEAVATIKAGAADYVLKDRPRRLVLAVQNALATGELRAQRRRDEEALREGEERTRLILANALDAVITIDTVGRVLSWSPQAEVVFGWRADEILHRLLSDTIIPPAYRDAHAFGLERLRATGEGPALNRRLELTALRRDGTEFPVELAITPVRLKGSTVFSAFLRDITERRHAEETRKHQAEELERRVQERTLQLSVANEQLQKEIGERRRAEGDADRANQAKSDFLSRMSHELRTPLNAILGFGQLLEMQSLAADSKESVEQILMGGRHLLGLINEVLEIGRIEAGRLRIALEPVRLDEIVGEAIDLVRPLAAGVSVEIRTELADEHRSVLADRQRLQQVLLNLLSNAVKYNQTGGVVTVTCEAAPERRLRIGVTDTGCGIAPDKLARLFTPFDRLGAEATGVEGTGLGLALSKHLVEAMGGTLHAESRVAVGSTFSVELPIGPSPSAAGPRSAPPPPSEGGSDEVRVLVLYIEDNVSNLRLVERILALRPLVKLVSALQGQVGLDLAREHRPDLILLDRNLPDMRGDEVLDRLRRDPRTRRIPVVMLSAAAGPGQIQPLLDAGAQAYLTKPLNVHQVLALVDGLGPRLG